jgi:dolichol kinase
MQFFTTQALSEIPLVMLISGAVLAGLWTANIVYDLGVPNYISRKIGHGAGGLAFLASALLSSAGWPIIVSAVFGSLLLLAHISRPHAFRGVGGAGRREGILAEVWFAWVAVPVYAVAWLWLKLPGVAVACLLFMAWGDGVTGLVRSQVYKRPVKGRWGSLAMLGTCLVIAAVFVRPPWIGAAAALVAVGAERLFGEYGTLRWGDDNWAIPLFSLVTILGLMAVSGNL